MKVSSVKPEFKSLSREGKTFNDLGIVLRAHKLGEADRILRVLCRDHGKRSAVAKGIRKTHSRFGARLELFSCVRMMIYRGKSLDIVKQAEIYDSFKEIRENIEIFAAAQVIAEFTDLMTHENEPCPEVFDLVYGCLSLLREHPEKVDLILPFFDFRLLSISGVGISVASCATCGIPLSSSSNVLSPKDGGFLCTNCEKKKKVNGGLIRLSNGAREGFKYISNLELDRVYTEGIPEKAINEIRFVMDRMVEYVTERESRARKVFKNLRTGGR